MKAKLLILVAFCALLISAIDLGDITGAAYAADSGWIVTCNFSHSLPDDPIVFPGAAGASHLHDFVGATTTNANSTPQTLLAGGTTCLIPGDKSAYWVPALYANGQRILPQGTSKHALFYYRRKGAANGVVVQAFPLGLKMIVGNAHASGPYANSRIIWKCGPGSGTDLPQPPTQCNSGVMVVSLQFPNCWDGKNLDSANHSSHMAYPNGNSCPASHPVVLPRIESFFRYQVGTGPIGTITLASGGWWSLHQDFLNAWLPADLQKLIDKCINPGQDCGTNPPIP